MALVERRDATMLEQWDTDTRTYRRYEDGTLCEERPFTQDETASTEQQLADATRSGNTAVLLARARADLATNQAYLDLVAGGTVTADDTVAQVAQLSQQALGFIRLTVGADLLDQLDQHPDDPPVEQPPGTTDPTDPPADPTGT
ncbi:hypothetical protein [Streptomyces sp. NPDC044948]|uniref:hypothetical protein n=1 Tax=Streptomyces sp. NPDC044948 TaxID=3157092 RepID=UPI0033F3A44B